VYRVGTIVGAEAARGLGGVAAAGRPQGGLTPVNHTR